MTKREAWQSAFLGLLSGIYLTAAFVHPYEQEISLQELVFQLSGSRGSFVMGCSLPELTGYMLRMMPGYAISMLWGIDLYRHFCTASIYVFSRCTDRLKWYRGILISLFLKVLLYETALTGTVVLLSSLFFRVRLWQEGLPILICHLVFFWLWHFSWILLMNLLALPFGSSMAAAVVMGIQAAGLAGLGVAGFLETKHVSGLIVEKLVRLNPISYTILGWQFKGIYAFRPEQCLLFLTIFCMTVLLAGGIIIRTFEILTENPETETI